MTVGGMGFIPERLLMMMMMKRLKQKNVKRTNNSNTKKYRKGLTPKVMPPTKGEHVKLKATLQTLKKPGAGPQQQT